MASGKGGRFTLFAGWLIDGSGGPPQRNVRLEIAEGRLRAIRGFKPFEPLPPAEGGVLDCRDCTVIPPLVDSHVHLAFDGLAPGGTLPPPAAAEARLRQNVRRLISRGVFAVRDAGDADGLGLSLARRAGANAPLRVLSAGKAFYRPGRYGVILGQALPPGVSPAARMERDAEGRQTVKVVNSGLNSLVEFGRETPPQFGAGELSALVRASALRGLSVMVHANGVEPVACAVRAGVHSIEHGFFMGGENLAALADAAVFWVPTLVPLHACAERAPSGSREAEVARRTLDHQIEQLRRARALGVKVALGTDAGSPGVVHGDAVGEEMRLIMEAGFPVGEAVAAATAVGAELCGFGGGRLSPGAEASLLVLEGGPEEIPESLRRIRRILFAGEELSLGQ